MLVVCHSQRDTVALNWILKVERILCSWLYLPRVELLSQWPHKMMDEVQSYMQQEEPGTQCSEHTSLLRQKLVRGVCSCPLGGTPLLHAWSSGEGEEVCLPGQDCSGIP